MTTAELAALADELRALHEAPETLVLPNAWDAASARLFAGEMGYPAVATTSAFQQVATPVGSPRRATLATDMPTSRPIRCQRL